MWVSGASRKVVPESGIAVHGAICPETKLDAVQTSMGVVWFPADIPQSPRPHQLVVIDVIGLLSSGTFRRKAPPLALLRHSENLSIPAASKNPWSLHEGT